MSAPFTPPSQPVPDAVPPTARSAVSPLSRPGFVVSRALRVCAALLTLVVSVGSWYGASTLNSFATRGVAAGLPTADAPLVPGQDIGMQVFLNKESDPENVRRTVEMLRDGGVTWVRQVFDWCELETDGRGQYWDKKNNRPSWQKYDFIVEQLTQAHIRILARLDNAPAWSRPGKGTGACQPGPPNDLNTYADFVRNVTTHYKGKLAAVQIWNEPNLGGEWGGAINVVQYVDMLKRSYAAAKEGDPAVLVVAASLAPTLAPPPENLSDLTFYGQMYQAGAKGSFDVLGVNVYGLGEPPDDRRIAWSRFNVSRPVLVHDIMVKYDDTKTPIWATEFGYNSLPPGWDGKPSIWGANVDEATQARYLVGGLDRMTTEWPWMGTVFVWGFRWIEPPGTYGYFPGPVTGLKEPEPYFAVVNYDFTPRPAWNAIRDFIRGEAVRPGQIAATDSIVRAGAGWVRGTDGTTTSLVGTGTDATATVPVRGTEIAAIGEGAVRVAVDGRDHGTVRLASGKTTTLVANLEDTIHTVVLRPADANASVRLQRLLVGRQPPFAWTFPLFTLGAMIAALGAVGVLVREAIGAGRARRVASAWHAAAAVDPHYLTAYDTPSENAPDERRTPPPPPLGSGEPSA